MSFMMLPNPLLPLPDEAVDLPAGLATEERLKAALNTIDVTTLDHFVVGKDIVSFAERGLL